MRKLFYRHAVMLLILLAVSCQKDEYKAGTKTYTVAVVVPMTGGTQGQWKSTVDWAVSNIDGAQQNCRHKVKINVEMYDETTEDMDALGEKLAGRDEVKAVIGPVSQDRLDKMASQIKDSGKPLFAISAGATDIVRKYVEKKDFFWAMTMTDISQCEVMLTTAATMGHTHCTLICCDESTSAQTFKDWFAFQVTELGLSLRGNDIYSSSDEIPSLLKESILAEDAGQEAILCIPKDDYEARLMLSTVNELMKQCPAGKEPLIYFSSDIVQAKVSDLGLDFNFMSVYPFVDPQSGFYSAFYAHTGKTSFTFESQLYDALMLSAIALSYDSGDLKSSLKTVTEVDGSDLRAWSKEGMSQIFSEIENGGISHHITGTSSSLQFDEDNHTSVTKSHFMLCYFNDGNYSPLAYYSPQGSGKTESTISDWNWQVTHLQELEPTTKTFDYPTLDKRWAIVVATSCGWENYRHQADALNVYQYLKSSGYDDDHILFVIADDIANDSNNKKKGEVRISPDGENLYHDLKIDYKLDDLSLDEFLDKIVAIPSDSDDNIFVFWSGHGSSAGPSWNGSARMTEWRMSDLMERMQGHYRKMLWCIESCYAGVAGMGVEGYPGVMAMTAANAYETSKAAVYNSDMNIWMSNRFSIYLIESLKTYDWTIRELFYYLSSHTLGSHASLYNYQNYDDITVAGFKEYF